jgi:hypothetical protein
MLNMNLVLADANGKIGAWGNTFKITREQRKSPRQFHLFVTFKSRSLFEINNELSSFFFRLPCNVLKIIGL